jgi:hypothetical protein
MSEKKVYNKAAAEGSQSGQTEKAFRGKTGGAIAGLPVFDHGEKSMDVLEYEAAVRALVDYVSTHNFKGSHVIRFGKHFDWTKNRPEFALPAIPAGTAAETKKKIEEHYDREYGSRLGEWVKAQAKYLEECDTLRVSVGAVHLSIASQDPGS